ncbi:hypothetical protein GCM10009118_07890 [Wandonia haliotis]|uniref:HTH cro/C1-type domain-containing protein n=1 Tax=Wandonia haliotis TaxID=574963 RepID=A0ABN1MM77_9FLAO
MRDKEFLKIVGQRVRKYRKEAGYTQETFAEKCGLDRGAIARIEVGGINSSILKLKQIADSLKIEVSQLVSL